MLLNILLFLLLLLTIVIIHEFGHLCAAKLFGVYCSEFSIGMGPELYRHKGKETDFCIRALPLGGFVAMAGDSENDLESKVDADVPFERTLPGIAKWKQAIVMLAGIAMNFLLALVIVSGIFLYYGQIYNSPEPVISAVSTGSPAESAGIKAGDRILKITYDNGYSLSPDTFSEMGDFFATFDGQGSMHLLIDRDGKEVEISLIPEYNTEESRYIIGVSAESSTVVDINIFNCWIYAGSYLKEMTKLIMVTLLGLFRGVGLNNLSGPVGIYNATSEAASYGPDTYLNLMALISINIGIFNALPLPVMDGGRVVLLLIEAVTGHKLSEKFVNAIMTVSVMMLLALMVFATGQDVLRLFR